jgi:hypothetical protein
VKLESNTFSGLPSGSNLIDSSILVMFSVTYLALDDGAQFYRNGCIAVQLRYQLKRKNSRGLRGRLGSNALAGANQVSLTILTILVSETDFLKESTGIEGGLARVIQRHRFVEISGVLIFDFGQNRR